MNSKVEVNFVHFDREAEKVTLELRDVKGGRVLDCFEMGLREEKALDYLGERFRLTISGVRHPEPQHQTLFETRLTVKKGVQVTSARFKRSSTGEIVSDPSGEPVNFVCEE